jgi:hypothetical protein
MGAYIDKKVNNFNRTESESYLQSIIATSYTDMDTFAIFINFEERVQPQRDNLNTPKSINNICEVMVKN